MRGHKECPVTVATFTRLRGIQLFADAILSTGFVGVQWHVDSSVCKNRKTLYTQVLYWEVNSACDTLEGLVETPTEDRKRIAAASLGFVELVGAMKGHEISAVTGRRECADSVCRCSLSYAKAGLREPAGPDNLTGKLREVGDVLEGTGLFFEPGANVSPLAGAQQRSWYEPDRPGIVETVRKHEAAIAFLADTEPARTRSRHERVAACDPNRL